MLTENDYPKWFVQNALKKSSSSIFQHGVSLPNGRVFVFFERARKGNHLFYYD